MATGYVTLPGSADYLLTVDKAGLDITENITLVALIAPDDVTPAANMQIINKFPSSGGGRSYALLWRSDQLLQLNVSTTGTTNTHLIQSTATMPTLDGEWVWIRAQRDSTSGDISFWYSEDPPETALGSVSWTQLGTTVSAASGSIFAGTTDLNLGRFANTGGDYAGKIGGAWVISGLGVGGTIVADPDFRDDDQGWSTPPGVDDQSNSWAFNGDTFWTPPDLGSVSLYATATGTIIDVVDEIDTTIDLHLSIDDDPASPNDADWVNNAIAISGGDASLFVELTDMPTDFGNAEAGEIVVRYRGANYGSGTINLYARLYQSDESTALSDEVLVATVSSNGAFADSSLVPFTGINTTADKATWDAARIRFRWSTT